MDQETYLSVKEAARQFIGRPQPHVVRNWINDGLFGGRVKLKAKPSGGRWYTTQAWIDEFNAAVEAERAKPSGNGAAPETPAATAKRRAATAKRLAKHGL